MHQGRSRRGKADVRIGIDIGGTKIEGIALGADGHILARRRIAAPRLVYAETLAAVAGLVATIEAETGQTGTVGVGIPGAIAEATGRVKNANSTWLIGEALEADLASALGRPVRLENDANCFALSEATDGAGRGAGVVFGAILGTGVGGGIVIDGKLLVGRNRIAGEWGHNPLPWPNDDERPGPPCYCGLSGCIETFLSGPGFARDDAARGGAVRTPAAIVAAAAAGEAIASASLARYEDRLARALAAVINLLDPEIIVLGGGLSQIARLYDTVPALLPRHVFSDRVTTKILPPAHGDTSGVRGAAWLWPGR
ncbi:MAG: ROK family protein [Alphaproteobacteria bacterium]|nr:ROK family protein [Alphaproteobacteria bacterium]